MTAEPIELLFVEDTEVDVELALRALERDGFVPTWRRVDLEEDMRRALSAQLPQAILSDFSMPRFDGFAALRLATAMAPEVPFLFVSGTIGEETALEAVRLGATDYVLKSNLRRLGTSLRRALVEAEEHRRVGIAEEERGRLVEILEATSDYVGMADPEGRILYLNASGRRLIGVPSAGALDLQIDRIYPAWRPLTDHRPDAAVAVPERVLQSETAIVDAGGVEIPVSQVLITHRSAEGAIRFYSVIARDIRERRAQEARIQYLANHDAVTDLPNRSLLADRTAQMIAHARRQGRTAALILLNLDRFKLVLDNVGHAAGDKLLRAAGAKLCAAVRDGDTVARLSANVFAVLAGDLERPDEVVALVRKIQQALRPPFRCGDTDIRLTASIGASAAPRDGEEFEVLLSNADAAMSLAKAQGRNGFQFYAAEMTREATERRNLESELHRALEQGRLEMHYQPQLAFADGRVVGVEALMRWHHAERGWISPALFMPIAEDSDLIHELGAFALGESLRQLGEWSRAGLAPPRLAVNVSARQFRSEDFVELVRSTLHASRVDPRRLEIELTERVLVEDREEALVILKRLKALGVQVAVDDFGTGYSSLSYLSWLPIDCLKIDRSFVQRITERGRDAVIAQAVISLGHALGLRVLAEGVETAEQVAFLRAHACDECQGFYYSRALRADAIPAFVRSAGHDQENRRDEQNDPAGRRQRR